MTIFRVPDNKVFNLIFVDSSAYMSLAAKFPAKSPTNDQETVADGLENNNSQSSTRSNICFTEATQDEDGNQYFITEPVDMTEEMSLVDIEDLGNTVLPWAQSSSRRLVCLKFLCI